jgi:hypothetical protein
VRRQRQQHQALSRCGRQGRPDRSQRPLGRAARRTHARRERLCDPARHRRRARGRGAADHLAAAGAARPAGRSSPSSALFAAPIPPLTTAATSRPRPARSGRTQRRDRINLARPNNPLVHPSNPARRNSRARPNNPTRPNNPVRPSNPARRNNRQRRNNPANLAGKDRSRVRAVSNRRRCRRGPARFRNRRHPDNPPLSRGKAVCNRARPDRQNPACSGLPSRTGLCCRAGRRHRQRARKSARRGSSSRDAA